MKVTASAPGSIMILGEHAVVYGHPAIVAAIDQRVTVVATALDDERVELVSDIAPPVETTLDALSAKGDLPFVQAAVLAFRGRMSHGVGLEITSEIDPTLGLGSSAAVTVACLGAIAHLAGASKEGLHRAALGIVRNRQGRGSGADLAASLSGGLMSYQLASDGVEACIRSLPSPPEFALRHAGYKTPTGEVLAKVAADWDGRTAEVEGLYARMGAVAERGIAAASREDWDGLAVAMGDYQALMAELGVSDAVLERLVARALEVSGVMAAKISGSGLGDCVVAMGAVPEGFVAAPLAERGLVVDG
ncbi:MAG: mevalonate kinase [Pseudomonadota bacterium]